MQADGTRGQCLGMCWGRGEPARHEGLRGSVWQPLSEPDEEGAHVPGRPVGGAGWGAGDPTHGEQCRR